MALQLTRTTPGLLYRPDLSNPTGTAGAGWSVVAAPSVCCFGATPLTILAPGTGSDAGGVREVVPNLAADGTWTLIYGAGDGTSGSGGHWRPQYATSTDGGLTFTRHGNVLGGDGISPGGDGTQVCRDMGHAALVNGRYYLYPIFAPTDTAASNGKGYVPSGSWNSDVFTSDSGWGGPWTFERVVLTPNTLAVNTTGSSTAGGAYASDMLADGTGTYRLFFGQSTSTGNNFNVGVLTSADPGFNTPGDVIRDILPWQPYSSYQGENPKVVWNGYLGCWVMTANGAENHGSGITTVNFAYVNSGPTTWTTAAVNAEVVQRVSPAHGAKAIGIFSPFNIAGGSHYVTADGFIPGLFDANPDSTATVTTVAVGRSIYGAVLEPSRYAVRYTHRNAVTLGDAFSAANGTALATYGNGWSVVSSAGGTPGIVVDALGTWLSLGSAVGATLVTNSGVNQADGVYEFDTLADVNCSASLVVRYTNSSNYVFLDVGWPNGVTLNSPSVSGYQVSGGTLTQTGTTDVLPVQIPAGSRVRVRWVVNGSTAFLYINGRYMTAVTNLTVTAAGAVGFRNGNAGTGKRYVGNLSVAGLSDLSETRYSEAVTNGDAVHEFAFTIVGSYSPGRLYYDYRVQPSGDSYRLRIDYGGGISLWKSTGGVAGTPGTYTQLSAGSGTLTTKQPYSHTVRLVASGNNHKAYLDGELQVDFTDSTGSPYAGGAGVAWAASGLDVNVRLPHVRSSSVVTIHGLTGGQSVVLRSPGGIPVESGTAGGTTYTSAALTHYPLGQVEIAGTRYAPADGGLVWGGDVLTLETAPTPPPPQATGIIFI